MIDYETGEIIMVLAPTGRGRGRAWRVARVEGVGAQTVTVIRTGKYRQDYLYSETRPRYADLPHITRL